MHERRPPTTTAQDRGATFWSLLPLVVLPRRSPALFYRPARRRRSVALPSALIGKPAPPTELPPVPGLDVDGKPVPGLSNATFAGSVTLVNVWASWCVPCHDEVPLLEALGKDKRIQLVGINYKDAPDNARRFLDRYGNPFVATGATRTAAPRSTGASMACRRPSWSAATAASPTS